MKSVKMVSLIPVLSHVPNIFKELQKTLPNVNFHKVEEPDTDKYFKDSEIIITDFDLIGPYIYDLPNVKWICGTWAGIDKLTPFIQKDKPLSCKITRFTGDYFGKIMSEYVIANIVRHERNFDALRESQTLQKWNKDGWFQDYRIISDLTIGILGIGNIGNKIGHNLSLLGAKILAYGRRPSLPAIAEYNYIGQYYNRNNFEMLLKDSDYIVNVLPKTEETNGILDGGILENCKEKQTVFINIGRSNIISEESLIRALKSQWLSAAILDVFDKEPLPTDSPLWKNDKIIITPHVAGITRAKDVADLFSVNLNLFQKNQPLYAEIDFKKGY